MNRASRSAAFHALATGPRLLVLCAVVAAIGRASITPAADAESLVLKGHEQYVLCLDISADGKRIVSGSSDKTVRIWDAENGKEMAVLKGHPGMVFAVALSKDGKTVASADDNNTIKLWDPATGKERATLKGHKQAVTSVVFTADDKTLISSSHDGTIQLWDVAARKHRKTVGAKSGIVSMAVLPDAKHAVFVEPTGTRVWDLATAKEQKTIPILGASRLHSVSSDSAGKVVAVPDQTGRVLVWNVATAQKVDEFNIGVQAFSTAMSGDGALLAVGYPGGLKFFDLKRHREISTTKLDDHVYVVAFTADGKMLAGGGRDRVIRLWKTPEAK